MVGRTAEHRAREATDLRTALLGSAHPDVAADLAVVAAALFEQQRHEEAEPLFQRALAIFADHYGPDHLEVAVNIGNLAALYSQAGRLQAAESAYLQSLRIKTDLLGPMHVDVGRLLNNLAMLRERQGHRAAAVDLLDSASLIFDAALGLTTAVRAAAARP